MAFMLLMTLASLKSQPYRERFIKLQKVHESKSNFVQKVLKQAAGNSRDTVCSFRFLRNNLHDTITALLPIVPRT